ncbi:MAG: NAD(P)H-dependent oxidoreductase [Syntrophales bacterium]|nr:NAD(P)H-dependent oxidoreductase [Syntrophales bacterium]
MDILILNGSPKGAESVTMQYVNLWQKKAPTHSFTILNVAQQIGRYEKGEGFDELVSRLDKAEGVVWAFPLYYCLVCSQYKRFIECLFERGWGEHFRGKYAAALSTSIHFYDHTAHNYIRAISEDMGMKFYSSFSADMDDMLKERERGMFLKWGEDFIAAIERGAPIERWTAPITYEQMSYEPGDVISKVDPKGKKILVLVDSTDESSNEAKMAERFARSFSSSVNIVRLQDVPMKGGCLGCMECAFDNECIYNDGYRDFFENVVRVSDVVVFVGAIKDRYLSSRFKRFLDRSFYNGHTPAYRGKQVAYILSGPFRQNANLQEILQGQTEISGGHLAGVVTDEAKEGKMIDALLDDLAQRLVDYASSNYVRPMTFLGVGGHKIFRDEIFSRLRFPFQADYRFYEENGLFDFPQKDTRYLEFGEKMTALIQDPEIRKQVRKMLKTEMLRSYKKVVETK